MRMDLLSKGISVPLIEQAFKEEYAGEEIQLIRQLLQNGDMTGLRRIGRSSRGYMHFDAEGISERGYFKCNERFRMLDIISK